MPTVCRPWGSSWEQKQQLPALLRVPCPGGPVWLPLSPDLGCGPPDTQAEQAHHLGLLCSQHI